MKGCSNREKFSLGNESGFRDICDIDERRFRTYLAFFYLVKVSTIFLHCFVSLSQFYSG